jgi:hypothetical protein
MQSFSGKRWYLASLVLGPALLFGCGGGGGNGALGQIAVDAPLGDGDLPGGSGSGAFTPNYVSKLQSLSHWAQFPVTIHFVRDTNYTPARQELATAGFDAWVRQLGGSVSYALTDDPAQAQVSVRFAQKLDDNLIGWTSWSYDSSMRITHAEIKIGLALVSDVDIPWIGAHELGHALGLDGHSDASVDVMFPSHILSSAWALTERDVNTVKTAHYWLFGRGSAPDPTVGAPVGAVDVKCYRPHE